MPQIHEGGCQCGVVRYRITGEATALFACHCSHCQRQSGSAFGLSMRLAADQFQLIKGELKGFARPGNDRIITGSFCPDCGTHIHHKLGDQPDVISLKPGTLDDTEWLLQPVLVFTDNAQDWYQMPDDATFHRETAGQSA